MSGATAVDELLDILGNDTRRRILVILADEPKYFIQLSRELGVSQQAVLKHLSLLEEAGLVSSFRAKSELAAPDRKYYRLKRSLYLTVGIMGDTVELDLTEIGDAQGFEDDDISEELRHFRTEVDRLVRERNPSTTIQLTESLLKEIDNRIDMLEEEKVGLLAIRQEVMQTVHGAIRESLQEDLHRRIMYEILGRQRMTAEELADILNVREKEIKQALGIIGEKFAIRMTP
jgi:predicted transcriptional regulator